MTPEREFRGDFDGLAGLMERAWSGNRDQSLLYTSDFMASILNSPGVGPVLTSAFYSQDEPIAFIAAFPRRVRLIDQALRLAATTFLTVDPGHQGRAYGAAVWSALTKRVRLAGYEGTLNFCVEGSPSNAIVRLCSERLGYTTTRLFSTPYLAGLIGEKRDSDRAEPSDDDVELFVELTAAISSPPLVRLWTEAEAAWQCRGRYGGVCVRHESGTRRGILTGYVMNVINGSKCLLLEDLLWGSLESAERIQLTEKLLNAGAAAGAQFAVAPLMGYADEEPLRRCGLRKSRRLVNVYLTRWTGEGDDQPMKSIYLDIF